MERPSKKTVVAWRNFIASPDGVSGLLYLKSHSPQPFPDDDGKMIFAAGQVSGFNIFFTSLDSMVEDSASGSGDEAQDRLDQ